MRDEIDENETLRYENEDEDENETLRYENEDEDETLRYETAAPTKRFATKTGSAVTVTIGYVIL